MKHHAATCVYCTHRRGLTTRPAINKSITPQFEYIGVPQQRQRAFVTRGGVRLAAIPTVRASTKPGETLKKVSPADAERFGLRLPATTP